MVVSYQSDAKDTDDDCGDEADDGPNDGNDGSEKGVSDNGKRADKFGSAFSQ